MKYFILLIALMACMILGAVILFSFYIAVIPYSDLVDEAATVTQTDVPPVKTPRAPLPPADKNNLAKLKQMANGVREAMTEESIAKMEKWNRMDARLSSPRELAKARAGAPFFKELYLIGEEAKDTLRSLISDENEDIRRSSTLLLQQWPFLQGGMKQSDIDLAKSLTQTLTIPLLEEALLNRDAEVRYHACCALGDLTDFDHALETLYRSVSKMQLLRDDSVVEVRGIAYTACGRILRIVSEKAMDPKIRAEAGKGNDKHSRQPRW